MPELDLPDEDIDTLLEVLTPAKIAMSHGMTELEAARLLSAVIPILERVMPGELMVQDKRVVKAIALYKRVYRSEFVPVYGRVQ